LRLAWCTSARFWRDECTPDQRPWPTSNFADRGTYRRLVDAPRPCCGRLYFKPLSSLPADRSAVDRLARSNLVFHQPASRPRNAMADHSKDFVECILTRLTPQVTETTARDPLVSSRTRAGRDGRLTQRKRRTAVAHAPDFFPGAVPALAAPASRSRCRRCGIARRKITCCDERRADDLRQDTHETVADTPDKDPSPVDMRLARFNDAVSLLPSGARPIAPSRSGLFWAEGRFLG